MTKPEEYPQLDVIAVGAHPDDVEIACGGTLAERLAKQGYRVGIIDLTDGEPTPLSPGPEVRLAEAERAAKVLGVTSAFSWTCPIGGCSTPSRAHGARPWSVNTGQSWCWVLARKRRSLRPIIGRRCRSRTPPCSMRG